MSKHNIYPLQIVTYAHDLFATVQCDRPYKGADQSVTHHIEALKEDIAHGRIQEVAWVSTHDMLVDAMTKNMPDVLVSKMMETGYWPPQAEYKVFASSDAFFADTLELCIHNECPRLWQETTPFLWWHQPVV